MEPRPTKRSSAASSWRCRTSSSARPIPTSRRTLTDAYRRYRAGELAADELPDLADIFPDDPLVRAQIGLQTEPDATPADALIQACGSCHNDVLDQTISRARFNIDLARLDRAAIERAIERIELPPPRAARCRQPKRGSSTHRRASG